MTIFPKRVQQEQVPRENKAKQKTSYMQVISVDCVKAVRPCQVPQGNSANSPPESQDTSWEATHP